MAALLVTAAVLALLAGTLAWSARRVAREAARLTSTLSGLRAVQAALVALRTDSVPPARRR